MNQPLKEYHMTLETIGPVYIGNGRKIEKKGYIFTDKKHVRIMDVEKLYMYLKKKGIAAEYENYLLGNDDNRGKRLEEWLKLKRISIAELSDCTKYSMECGEAIDYTKKGGGNQVAICEHIKDAYNMPYIPGSSIKGMLRTILLADDIIKNNREYQHIKNGIDYEIEKAARQGKVYKKSFLSDPITTAETDYFNKLNRNSKKKTDAVNDIMSKIIVSDSSPVDINNLILCKKLEGHTSGKEHQINVVRECIKPGTKISFTLTIVSDNSGNDITIQKIMRAVESFARNYNEVFVSRFKDADLLNDDYVLLGGGSGFVSKTVIYPMFGQMEGSRKTNFILNNTTLKTREKKERDSEAGASPHIIKYAGYNGKILQMGLCRLACEDTY